MNTFWKWLLGDEAFRQGTPELHWVNMPESWVVFVLILVVGAVGAFVFWLYSREIDTCPRPVRWFLAILRFSVLLLLVLLFLKPSLVFRQVNVIKSGIAVLRDSSLSFSQKDKYTDDGLVSGIVNATGLPAARIREGHFPRSALLQSALDKDHGKLIRQLRGKGFLRVVDFSESGSVAATIPALTDRELASLESAGPASGTQPEGEPAINNTRTFSSTTLTVSLSRVLS